MRSRRLYIVNGSTQVTDDEAKKIAHACNVQISRDAAPAWEKTRVVVEYHNGRDLESVQKAVPAGSWVLILLDQPDSAGVLGWHWTDDTDRVYSEVFTAPCFQAGSTALDGTYAVSSVVSHEVLETFGDPFCNGWSDSGRGFLLAQELCDPVEADGYKIDGVTVSNFVLPEYFDPTVSAGEKFDWLNRLTQPFSMSPGGYWVQMASGAESQKFAMTMIWETEVGFDVRDGGDDAVEVVFSPEMPEWKRDLKLLAHSRNARKRELVRAAS